MDMMDDEYKKEWDKDVQDMPTDPEAEMVPDDAAAEGATETPAVAVVMPAEEPAGEALSPEDEQRSKSWEGRLRKMEEELKAREAALAERESADAPMEPAPAQEMAEEASEEAPAGDGSVLERVKARALELANGGGLEAALAEAVESYGEDFLSLAAAVAAAMVDAKTPDLDAKFNGRIESLVSDVQAAFASQHLSAISEAHEDFEQIVESPEFQAWVDGLPDEDKAKAQEIIERGSAGRVIKMLQAFKDSLNGDDDGADAALGVRSSAAVRLPAKLSANQDDEYLAAWNAA